MVSASPQAASVSGSGNATTSRENCPSQKKCVGPRLTDTGWGNFYATIAGIGKMVASGGAVSREMLQKSIEVTDSNAAFFDAANDFSGCIVGLHEILRHQGILEGTWRLDLQETFGPGQLDEINHVVAAYPRI